MIQKLGLPVILSVLVLFTSCVPQKNLIYMQNENKEKESSQKIDRNYELTVQHDDQLAISISSKDKELIVPFNNNTLIGSGVTPLTGQATSSTINGQDGIAYFQVDHNGFIDFPILGKLQVLGMTREDVGNMIEDLLISGNHIKDPMVNVKFINFKVSVLGEVNRPGVQNIKGERITLLEALAYAGDLKPTGQRKNVKVVREEDGIRKIYLIDLTSEKDVVESPAYYLQQNDVVYVEPNKSLGVKGSATIATIASLTGIASIAVSIVSLVFAITNK